MGGGILIMGEETTGPLTGGKDTRRRIISSAIRGIPVVGLFYQTFSENRLDDFSIVKHCCYFGVTACLISVNVTARLDVPGGIDENLPSSMVRAGDHVYSQQLRLGNSPQGTFTLDSQGQINYERFSGLTLDDVARQ